MSDRNDVLARLSRLERENRRLKRAGTLLSLALVIAVAVGFVAPSDGVVRGERLELTTPGGEVYAHIQLDDRGSPLLAMRKDEAQALLTLDRPALFLRDTDGRRGAFIGFDRRGLGKVALTGEKLTDGVRLTMTEEGAAAVDVLDEAGYTRGSMRYAKEEGMGLFMHDDSGGLRSSSGVDKEGNSSMLLIDAIGRRRAGMVVESDGTPLISITDERQVPRINLSMEFDGTPQLEFLRPDGKVGTTLP
jgi:hypothetical protein